MSHRSYSRWDKSDNDYKDRLENKRSNRSRSRSRSPPQSSYGITSESYKNTNRSNHNRHPQPSSSSSSRPNGFIPDEETKKFYEKSTGDDTGFWTTEEYTFRDMIAKDIRNEIEDDIASKGSDEESEEDPELAEYADRADMDDEDDQQKKTIVERLIPIKKDEEKKKDLKPESTVTNQKTSSRK
ncbi:unnamed protein product [Adineta steineri]|uniref:Uncharacterized protein n=1 Tax=Adineta steineri TaxID=433720 RepID=A0A819GHH1_9BILA|nr:unnamed protein product [Adineta steineri]CAF3881895.1 unnamed protein product [Adineta steineri]